METKVSYFGQAGSKKGYHVEDRVGGPHYGYVRKLEDGTWGARDDEFYEWREPLDTFDTRHEAAMFLVSRNPHWVWDGGDTKLAVDFVGDVQRRDPEYADWLMQKSKECRV